MESFYSHPSLLGAQPEVIRLGQQTSLVCTLQGHHNAKDMSNFVPVKASLFGFLRHRAAFIWMNGAPPPKLDPDFNGWIHAPAPTSKSKMAAPRINSCESCKIHCSLALLSYLCVIKSVLHTVLSNFDLWPCIFSVCMSKTPCTGRVTPKIPPCNALLWTGIASSD